MAAYVKLTNFAVKDGLLSGNPLKVVTGSELDDEFNAIASSSQLNYTSLNNAIDASFIKWDFSTTTTMADPGSGIIRFNNATAASVTAIAVDDLNADGNDVSAYVVSWDDSTGSTNRGTLMLRQSASVFAIYSVTGLTDNSGWTQLAVTYVTGSGSFVDGTETYVSFYRTGEASADVSTVAGIAANVTTVAGIAPNVTTVAGISGNVTTVAGVSADVTTVAGNSTNVTTVAGSITSVNTVAANIDSINTKAIGYTFSTTTTMAEPGAGLMRFNNATLASVTAIALDDLNSSSQDVSAYVVTWDDSTNTNKGTVIVRQGSAFAIYTITGLTDNTGWTQLAVTHVTSGGSFSNSAATFVEFIRAGDKGVDGNATSYSVTTAVATASQTTFNVTYTAGYLDVYQNGVRLIPATDYTASNGTTVVLATGATLNDELMFVSWTAVVQQQAITVVGTWTTKTTNYTAASGDWLMCNTAGGAFTITLPATPPTNAFVRVASGPSASTNNVTVARNGSTLMALSEDMTISDNNIAVDFVYDGTTWRIA